MISVLLPLPDTPVTQVKVPSGMLAVTFCRLFSLAPLTVSQRPPLAGGSRRTLGIGTWRKPERYWPVRLALLRITSSGVPSAMTLPPWAPAPGPMSTRWSAARIASSSCSTTSTVLPRSRRRVSVFSSRSLSRWCRPIDGSSST